MVAAALAQRPGRGGHAWVVLSYLLGFRRLGWRVTLVDRLPPEACVDGRGAPVAPERSAGYRYARSVLERFGLEDAYCLLVDGRPEPVGPSRGALRAELRQADFLLNVMGFLDDPELCGDARRRVFVDIDPGFAQMWADLGQADVLAGHDAFLTVGTNIGRPGCRIPTMGRAWQATLPPVVMEQWPVQAGPGRAITTVASWRGPFGPVEHGGARYGLRAHELRPLAGMAADVGWPVEMALDIAPEDAVDRDRLLAGGWRLADPVAVAGSPDQYRRYVQESTAELTVAKGMYVRAASGWFSDRSACYLASGRPVVAQDTGIGVHLPTGDGLLVYRSAVEAGAALAEVLAHYPHHAGAARALAEEHLDSDQVLAALIDRALSQDVPAAGPGAAAPGVDVSARDPRTTIPDPGMTAPRSGFSVPASRMTIPDPGTTAAGSPMTIPTPGISAPGSGLTAPAPA